MNVFKRASSVAVVLAVLALPLGAANSAVADPAAALPRFVQVETGFSSSAALTEDGDVYTWGYGYNGQLGLGDGHDEAITPELVTFPGKPADDPVLEIALGGEHVLARTESGELWVWGANAYSQLGIGTTVDMWNPTPIGMSDYLAADETITAVAGGAGHSLVLTDAGRLFAWGANEWGQAVYSSWSTTITTPQLYAEIGQLFADNDAVPIALTASGASSYVASDDGWGYSWGYNGNGRLGLGTSAPSFDIGYVQFGGNLFGPSIVDIDAGYAHGIAALADGSVWTWGDLGAVEEPTPVAVAGLPDSSPVVAVAAGDGVSYALTEDGRVFAWGLNGPNAEGALGLGIGWEEQIDTPTQIQDWPEVRDGARIVDIAAGTNYTAGAISETGGVYMWGDTWARGDGATEVATSPVNIDLGALPAGSAAFEPTPPALGDTLDAVADGWPSNAVLSYRWELDGSPVESYPSYSPDSGEGLPLTLTVTGSAENWTPSEVTSAPAIIGTRPWFAWPLLPDAEAGVAYTATLPLVTSDPATFALTSGELPPGIDLDSDGTVNGTTTEAGEFTFEIVATTVYGTAEGDFTLVVTPGVTTALEVSVSATQVPQGGSLTFEVQGIDAFDNSTGDLTDDVVVTSDVLTDMVVGNTVTFPHASPHTLTVSYGQLTAQLVIEVVPQAAGDGAGLAATGAGGVALATALGVGLLAIGLASVMHRRSRRRA